jgi:hypothetical protein|tara:strand:+ start:1841 stop:2119 length:279 start_codon:yes stop_codon:yes gene_type:complete
MIDWNNTEGYELVVDAISDLIEVDCDLQEMPRINGSMWRTIHKIWILGKMQNVIEYLQMRRNEIKKDIKERTEQERAEQEIGQTPSNPGQGS